MTTAPIPFFLILVGGCSMRHSVASILDFGHTNSRIQKCQFQEFFTINNSGWIFLLCTYETVFNHIFLWLCLQFIHHFGEMSCAHSRQRRPCSKKIRTTSTSQRWTTTLKLSCIVGDVVGLPLHMSKVNAGYGLCRTLATPLRCLYMHIMRGAAGINNTCPT